MGNGIFDKIEKKTNVKKEDILNLARSIQGKDMKNEDNLKKLAYEAFDRGGLKEASPFFPFMKEKDLKILAEKSITLD